MKLLLKHMMGNDFEIFLWNGLEIIQITNNDFDDKNPSLYDGQIAWDGELGENWTSTEIFFWDGANVFQLTSNSISDSNPSLYNGDIAWRSGFSGSDGFTKILYATPSDDPAIITTSSDGLQARFFPSGEISIEVGQIQMFEFNPMPGYKVSDVLINGVSVGPVSFYIFENVAVDQTLDVFFVIDIENPVVYVSNQGSDQFGNGSIDNPFSTIQYAISAAIEGGQILVDDGVYNENLIISEKSIYLRSINGADNTAINANGTVIFIQNTTNDVTIDGFTINSISNGNGNSNSAKCIAADSSNIRIINNILNSNSNFNSSVYGVYLDNCEK